MVIILTGYGDMRSAVQALRLGAFDYLTKPVDMDRLLHTLGNGAEHRTLTLENRDLVRRLKEANRIKGEFIHGMSHEVRTPLGHILGFVQILQDTLDGLTEKQAHYLKNIESAASRLLRMFENILQFSILRSGDTQVAPASFPLNQFVEEILEPFKGATADKSIALEFGSDDSDRAAVADPRICGRSLSLLLDNAVRYTAEGGRVTVTCQIGPSPSTPVQDEDGSVPGAGAQGWLEVSVADTGPRVPPEDRERIFNVFEQVDSSLTRPHEGAGLSLALARSIARLHGGDIGLASRTGEGSTFTFAVPLSAEEATGKA